MRRDSVNRTEIIIVGGGHAGLGLAACLGAAGLDVVCLERGKNQFRAGSRKIVLDGRTLALSFRTMQVLRQAGVERLIKNEACPILDIRVADQDSLSYLDFHHQDVGDNPFGWIIDNTLFNAALEKRVAQLKSVQLIRDAAVAGIERDSSAACVMLEDGRIFEADLIVGADGRKSQCREAAGIPAYGWGYHQTAIVCTIRHSQPHHHVAVEHFLPGGPFATLPMTQQRSSIVWTEKTAAAATLMQLDEGEFTARLQEKVEAYLGTIQLTGPRFAYPLSLQHAEHYTAERLVLIGDAAHGIHPIAGQGFNLGMGDIDALTDELGKAAALGLDFGSPDLLKRYERRRKFDNGNMVLMTDLLDRLFSNAVPPVQAARRFGLGMVQRLPALRRYFMRTAMGGLKQDAVRAEQV